MHASASLSARSESHAHVVFLVRDDLNTFPLRASAMCADELWGRCEHSQVNAILEAEPREVVGIAVKSLAVQDLITADTFV